MMTFPFPHHYVGIFLFFFSWAVEPTPSGKYAHVKLDHETPQILGETWKIFELPPPRIFVVACFLSRGYVCF